MVQLSAGHSIKTNSERRFYSPNVSLMFTLVFIILVLQIPEANVLTGELCTLKKSKFYFWFICFSSFFELKVLSHSFCVELLQMEIDFLAIMLSYTINVLIFACTNFHKIYRFHEFFSKFAKIDVCKISHNPRFVKINVCIKNEEDS